MQLFPSKANVSYLKHGYDVNVYADLYLEMQCNEEESFIFFFSTILLKSFRERCAWTLFPISFSSVCTTTMSIDRMPAN